MQIEERNSIWIQDGKTVRKGSLYGTMKKLPEKVYTFRETPFGPILNYESESFHLPKKIYGLQNKFLERIVKTWENSTGNMGILLNGFKGTGKTIFAKLLCNTLNLPVICVTDESEMLPSFISEVDQDVVVFIDEYDKIYKDSSSLLTIMDGLLTNNNRILFILTTNKLSVNEYMLSRPSRIRYTKTFDFLSKKEIIEIVDDLCYDYDQDFKNKVIAGLSKIESLTVDIALKFIEEALIHTDYTEEELSEDFNIERKILYDVTYEIRSVANKELVYKGNFTVEDDFYRRMITSFQYCHKGKSFDYYYDFIQMLFKDIPGFMNEGCIKCIDTDLKGNRIFKHIFGKYEKNYFPDVEDQSFTIDFTANVSLGGFFNVIGTYDEEGSVMYINKDNSISEAENANTVSLSEG